MTVEVVGRQYLHLACRVGHSYSIEEFLADKESVFEAHLWRTVYLAEELGTIPVERLAEVLTDLAHGREASANGGRVAGPHPGAASAPLP
jgi:hypothetical protein